MQGRLLFLFLNDDYEEQEVCLYDGEPDHLELAIKNAQHDEGGYVVLLELDSGEIRLVGTRFPAKYVPIWRANAGPEGSKIVRVIVFGIHPRYEKIKRLLLACLANSESKILRHTVDEVIDRARVLFSISPATNAHLDRAMKELGAV